MVRLLLSLYMLIGSVNLLAQQLQAERLTLLFVGDLMQHRAQLDAARRPDGSYDFASCFELLKPLISEADLAVGNLEVPLGGAPYGGYPAFCAPDDYLHALLDSGFDLLLTANNHCLDRQGRGLARTLRLLDSLQVAHTGTFLSPADRRERYPLLVEKKGFRLVFLNYTYGTNGLTATPPYMVNLIDKPQMQADIARARAMRPDAIIACMHWGEEYHSLPNRQQRELADWLLSQGVTHVIGSHPHVIQPVERRASTSGQPTERRASTSGQPLERRSGGHIVAYSLGNFISNMSAPHTDGGLILHLELVKPAPPQPAPPFAASPFAAPNASTHAIPSPQCSTRADSTRFTPLHPYCTLGRCSYELVWTARPTVSGLHNYLLCPAEGALPFRSSQAEALRRAFVRSERNLLNQYNIDVKERLAPATVGP